MLRCYVLHLKHITVKLGPRRTAAAEQRS